MCGGVRHARGVRTLAATPAAQRLLLVLALGLRKLAFTVSAENPSHGVHAARSAICKARSKSEDAAAC